MFSWPVAQLTQTVFIPCSSEAWKKREKNYWTYWFIFAALLLLCKSDRIDSFRGQLRTGIRYRATQSIKKPNFHNCYYAFKPVITVMSKAPWDLVLELQKCWRTIVTDFNYKMKCTIPISFFPSFVVIKRTAAVLQEIQRQRTTFTSFVFQLMLFPLCMASKLTDCRLTWYSPSLKPQTHEFVFT